MSSKSKLKRQLKKQSIKHQLEISDATIEIEKLDYELSLLETRIEIILDTNKELVSKLEKIQLDYVEEKIPAFEGIKC